jgi:hypothetical protein
MSARLVFHRSPFVVIFRGIIERTQPDRPRGPGGAGVVVAQPKVFISYRRSDSLAQTGRLYDRLNRAFPGMFFRDVSEIGVGVDFVNQVERAVGASVALLAVIGPTWATATDERGRRLDDADDFVRVEVRTALTRKIRIIPVLVGNAEMVTEEQLPEDLKPLSRWNAIRIVEDYYDEGIEKLVRSLVPELGEPAREDNDQHEADARIKALRGEAEAAIGVEDWFGGIQALQAALSLAPNNFEISARLKYANDQRKLSGLFGEAQELYDKGKKAAALTKFRQVKVGGGNYRGVDELIQQLEREISNESRRSTVRRWTFGAVASVAGVIAVVVALVVMQIRSEFGDSNDSSNPAAPTSNSQVTPAANTGDPKAGPPQSASPPQPARNDAAEIAARAAQVLEQQRAAGGYAQNGGTQGTGFTPMGRFRAVNHLNQAMTFGLVLNPNATFQVQANAGGFSVPLSGGSFGYDPSTGIMLLSGMNNMRNYFTEQLQVYERHDGHFHVNYSGAQWDLYPE